MKKLLLIATLFTIVSEANAQFRGRGDVGFYRGRSSMITPRIGYGQIYPYFGFRAYYPYYGYQPYWHYNGMSKLDRKLSIIRQDYADKIHSVRLDHTLAGKERRAKVRELRQERQDTLYEAKRNYYRS